MNRVVITGGAGFIGSHLAEELAEDNEVIIIDDLSSGSIKNIETLISKNNVKLIQASIIDLEILQKVLFGADFVFHLAAIASVPQSIKDPFTSHQVNITGTLNILTAARDNNIRKVVYASSSAVYGDTPEIPIKEEVSPNPQSPYAVNKLAGEYYCRVFQYIYGLPTVSLRYFNVYGPRQDSNSQYAAVIPKFIERVLVNESPIIFGDGSQTRDFVFVKDVVQANILAAQSDMAGIFNIGSGQVTSINDLACTIINTMKKNLKAIHKEYRMGDILHSVADISKARGLGYYPKYKLEEGLYYLIANSNRGTYNNRD